MVYEGNMGEKKCHVCDDTGRMLVRFTRLMGATYSFDDPWKGDEHYEPCSLCGNKETGKIVMKGGEK